MRCVECPTAPAAAPESVPVEFGIAGGSARSEFERRKTKRHAETRDRWGKRLGGLVIALTDEPRSTRAWAIGARGEEKLAVELAKVDGLQVLNDRRVPGTRSNIDHVVISPGGVFVVDAKLYKGQVEIRNVGWFFKPDDRLYVGGRDRSRLARNMGWQVTAVENALRSAEIEALPPITPVLCFIDADWPLFRPPDSYLGVRLEGTRSVKKLLTGQQLLEASEIEALTRILAAALPSAARP
jgi:hypothetical protein